MTYILGLSSFTRHLQAFKDTYDRWIFFLNLNIASFFPVKSKLIIILYTT